MTKRPRLYLAQSHDRSAQTSIIVLEVRGQPSLYWEQVVREQGSTFASSSVQVEFALKIAREEGLRDFDLFLMGRSGMLGPLHDPDLGHVRIRWIARRKNLNARLRARRRLRELFPRPMEEKERCSLADYGVDLEIAAAEEEAGAELEGCPVDRHNVAGTRRFRL